MSLKKLPILARSRRGVSSEAGVSMLEIIVAMTMTATVMLGSVTLVNRAVAQVGSVQTSLAAQPTRFKAAGYHWLQSEVEYMRSLGFPTLLAALTGPEQASPAYVQNGGGSVSRTIDAQNRAPGEQPLPSGYARALVTIAAESLDRCPTSCEVGTISVRIDLFVTATDTEPVVAVQTSLVRR